MNLKYTALLLAMAPVFAFAQSANTITFIGEVSANTCAMNVNGNGASTSVSLPTASATQLDAIGKTAQLTTFTVGVTGCTTNATLPTNLNTKFVPVGPLTATGGRLQNTGVATGVSLELTNEAGTTPIVLLANGTSVAGLVVPATQTAATVNFGVRYHAESATIVAGSVTGAVQYSINYQ
jgi:major type 1 subunit fimbrin (pilin)